MRLIKVALVAVVLAAVTACSLVERAGIFVNDNPVVADMVVRQAVARYIDAADGGEAKSQRAADVKIVVERTTKFLDGNPQSSVTGIMAVLDSNIAWDRLSAVDRLLVQDIMLMVQIQLAEKQAEDQLSADTVLAIRSLLRTAITAANTFI